MIVRIRDTLQNAKLLFCNYNVNVGYVLHPELDYLARLAAAIPHSSRRIQQTGSILSEKTHSFDWLY